MTVKLNKRFIIWLENQREYWREIAAREILPSLDELGDDFIKKAKALIDANEITYTEDPKGFTLFKDAIGHQRQEGGVRGFVNEVFLEIYVDQDAAPHYEWIRRGAEPFRNPFPHPNVIQWAERKLGLPPRRARAAAWSVAVNGQQVSPLSTLRNLPPSGQKGYDLFEDMENHGIIAEMLEDYRTEMERKIKTEVTNL